MMIPNVPSAAFIDPNTKDISSTWRFFFEQLVAQLQANNSDEGTKIPKQSAANVTALNNTKSTNNLLVNNDTGDLLFNKNGTFKTVQLA